MEYPIIRPGDEFATENPMALGAIINIVQAAKAVDNKSKATHAGIILESSGTSLESLWTVRSQNIWEAYKGKWILIVRNVNMTPDVYVAGLNKVKRHIGQWYPLPRLFLHFLGVAKWVHWSHVVCSELTAKFEVGCAEFLGPDRASGFLHNYYGINPDNLVDRWTESRYFETVFEGIVE